MNPEVVAVSGRIDGTYILILLFLPHSFKGDKQEKRNAIMNPTASYLDGEVIKKYINTHTQGSDAAVSPVACGILRKSLGGPSIFHGCRPRNPLRPAKEGLG